MGLVLTADQCDDLVIACTKQQNKGNVTELATDTQKFYALPHILKEKKVMFRGGIGLKDRLMVDHNDAAQNTGLFQDDTLNVGDFMKEITVPWRFTNTHWAYDVREQAFNSGEEQVYDLVKTRRAAAMIALTVLMEKNLWGKPANVDDVQTPFGLFYWIVFNATQGFNGGNPDGFPAGCAGLSSDSCARWANWTDQYTNVTEEDLLEGLAMAMEYTDFESPVDLPGNQKADDYQIYTTYSLQRKLVKLARDRNDNHGIELDPMRRPVHRGITITWVKALNDKYCNDDDPVIGVNWGTMYPICQNGWFMREQKPDKVGGQHNSRQAWIDFVWNTWCTNRRRNWAIQKSA